MSLVGATVFFATAAFRIELLLNWFTELRFSPDAASAYFYFSYF